jgi:hypothetical protein
MTDFFRSTRRAFLKNGALALAGTRMGAPLAVPGGADALDPSTLTPFVDALPIPRMMKAAGTRAHPEQAGHRIPYYRMAMRECREKVHRDLPPTVMWSFENSFPGPTIEVKSGEGAMVEWANELPARHFLPIDHTLHGADRSLPEVRSVIHLHGGRTPAGSDGYPEAWVVPGKTQSCFYPSKQDAALLFYHDHTMGINRLNIYAGMQGLFDRARCAGSRVASAFRQIRGAAADFGSLAEQRWPACLSGVGASGSPMGAGGLWQRDPGERQAAALYGCGAAALPTAHHERIEWTILSAGARK